MGTGLLLLVCVCHRPAGRTRCAAGRSPPPVSVTPQASRMYDGPSPLSAWHPVLASGSGQAKVSPSGDIPAGQVDSRLADSHWGASQPGRVMCAGTHTRAPGTVRPLHVEWSVSPSCLGNRQERCRLEEHTGLGLGLAAALCCCVTLDKGVDVSEHPCTCAQNKVTTLPASQDHCEEMKRNGPSRKQRTRELAARRQRAGGTGPQREGAAFHAECRDHPLKGTGHLPLSWCGVPSCHLRGTGSEK